METNSALGGPGKLPVNGWTRRDRPCDACRRRKSRCIIPQDAETCIMCQSRSEECTYIQNPQRRKRRRAEDENSPDATRPRYGSDDDRRLHGILELTAALDLQIPKEVR